MSEFQKLLQKKKAERDRNIENMEIGKIKFSPWAYQISDENFENSHNCDIHVLSISYIIYYITS